MTTRSKCARIMSATAALVTAALVLRCDAEAQSAGTAGSKPSLPSSLAPASAAALGALAAKIAADTGIADIALSDGRSRVTGKPAGLIANAPMVLLGRVSLAATDGAELLAWMKTTGSAVRIGHGGGWSATHACALQVQELVGITGTLVASPPDTTPLAMLKAGTVDVLCDAVPAAIPEITAGTINAYLLAADERVTGLWDVPTADQAGLPLLSATVWLGLYASGDEAARARLNAALQKALADEAVAQKLADAGWTAFPLTHRSAKAHEDYAASDVERTQAAFEAAGIALPAR